MDFIALGGLRGFASLWIVLFHCFDYSTYTIPLYNIVQIFYLLSGFTLAAAYGFKKQNDLDNKLNIWQFYQNRVARVLPVYYFTLVLVIPVYLNGFGDFAVDSLSDTYFLHSLLINIVPIQSWLMNYFGAILNFPSWTVCTLILMWVFFPNVITILQKKTDEKILEYMFYFYWFNFFFVLFELYSPYSDLILDWGWPAEFPITRFPIFLIGMCAGLLCVRHSDDKIPWPNTYFLLFPSFKDQLPKTATSLPSEENRPLISNTKDIPIQTSTVVKLSDAELWAKRADLFGFHFFPVTILMSLVLNVSYHLGWNPMTRLNDSWNLNFIANFVVCFAQISFIVALVRGGKDQSSWVISVMRSDIGQWLGDRSMCIYLIHWPIIRYFMWVNYGKSLTWPTSYTCSDYNTTSSSDVAAYNSCVSELEDYYTATELPFWATPVILFLTLLASHFLYLYVEEPARKYFSWRTNTAN